MYLTGNIYIKTYYYRILIGNFQYPYYLIFYIKEIKNNTQLKQ
jgi:hypothetical protein